MQQQPQGILVGVAPNKYVSGVNDTSNRADPLEPLALEQAISRTHATDAHFFTYHVVGDSRTTRWPRCNKPILPKMRMLGVDLHTQILVFDIDNPDHLKWEDYLPVDSWLTWFNQEFLPTCPMAGNYSCLYTTRAGVRLIYTLDQPIPVDDAENKHRWLAQTLKQRGLPVDLACSDWTRCFRLPYVYRDGSSTAHDPSTRLYVNWNARIPLASISEITREQASIYRREIRQFDEPIPERSHALALLKQHNPTTGREVMSEFLKSAKKKLTGRDCFGCLFKGEVLASEGLRDTTLHKYVGSVISMLFSMDGVGPEHIYALFLEAVDALEPDAGTPDWHEKLWDHIGRIWVREEAKQEEETVHQAEQVEAQQDLMERIIGGMQRWCKHPDLFRDKPTAQRFAARHLIVITNQSFHVMNPDGYYDSMPVNSTSLLARIRILGMNGVIDTERETDKGLVDIDARTIVNRHGCLVNSIKARPALEGGVIELIDSPHAELCLPLYALNPDLEPKFDPQVDQWLHLFFGRHYLEGCEWIAWALAFQEGPICALSLEGDPGIGKKLLTNGLSECLKIPRLASVGDMVGDFQYGLLESPFLIVNEGWPKGKWGVHPADSFRYLVDGSIPPVNRKFQAPVRVHSPLRIILTANNNSVVAMLGADRDLSPEDRDALTVRLKHMRLPKDAKFWLQQMGGMSFTSRPGRRWIAGDSGEPSDYVVARHFLALYHMRGDKTRGRRFLVDGTNDNELMNEFRTGAGSSPLVIEAVIKMLEHQSPQWRLPVDEDSGRVWSTTSKVLEYYRANMSQAANHRLGMRAIANSFRAICVEEPENSLTVDGLKARWWELDPELLLSIARRDGRKSDRLEHIVACRRRRTVETPFV